MLSHHTAKFCCLCVSGDIFLVIERQDSTCPRLDLPLLKSISKAHGTPYSHTKIQHIKTVICWCMQWRISDLGHRCLKEQLTELNKTFFASLSKNSVRKKDKKKMAMAKLFALHANPQKGNYKALYVTLKYKKKAKKFVAKFFDLHPNAKKETKFFSRLWKEFITSYQKRSSLLTRILQGFSRRKTFQLKRHFFCFDFNDDDFFG